MTLQEITGAVQAQRDYFEAGHTLSVKLRKQLLQRLRTAIVAHEDEINAALKTDLGKSKEESYMCEVGMTLSELSYLISHIKKYAKPRRVRTPVAQYLAKSFVYPSPYGAVLIMSPWNYPFLLSLEPLAAAIAAGNTVVLKPSAYSPATCDILVKIIEEVFCREHVFVVTGGREQNKALLETKFDYIFFTGSKTVGKLVYESAAQYMTPVTLELGGKSPCIVDSSAKIPLAARRIVFGKFLNCGQTCVAPDYILCAKDIKQKLVDAIKAEIVRQFGERPLQNEAYGKMISQKHFDRVAGLIDNDKAVCGGGLDRDALKIEPTVLDNVEWTDAVMGEEIFGPVLPILTFDSTNEVIDTVNAHDSPLALYIFSTDKKQIQTVLAKTRFGGGCINDVIIHLATSRLPFGGVGASGIGCYHGKYGFDTFTHYKGMVDKKNIIDLPMRYQPYKKFNSRLVRMFLK